MATDLKDILKGDIADDQPKAEATPEPEKVEQPDPQAEQPESDAELLPEAPEVEQAPQTETRPDKVVGGLKAAATAERNKRQQAEAEVKGLREELDRERASFRQEMAQMLSQFAPKQPEQPAPSVFDDPEGWQQRQAQNYEQRIRQTEIKMSERIARIQYGDDVYNEAEKAIEQYHRSNPNDPIFVAIPRSDDPAGLVVRWHQDRKKLSSLQSPESRVELLKESLKDPAVMALVQQAIQASAPANAAAPKPTPSQLPSNFAGARSVTGGTTKVFAGPTPIGDVFNRKK